MSDNTPAEQIDQPLSSLGWTLGSSFTAVSETDQLLKANAHHHRASRISGQRKDALKRVWESSGMVGRWLTEVFQLFSKPKKGERKIAIFLYSSIHYSGNHLYYNSIIKRCITNRNLLADYAHFTIILVSISCHSTMDQKQIKKQILIGQVPKHVG